MLRLVLIAALVTLTASVGYATEGNAAGESASGELPEWITDILMPLVAVSLGGLFAALFGLWQARRIRKLEREEEAKSVAVAIFSEIYNRAARCALDSTTWRGKCNAIEEMKRGRGQAPQISVGYLRKFRPVDPVVYPQLGDRLALLPPETLGNALTFFYRLDAVCSDIDKYANEPSNSLLPDDPSSHLAMRFRGSCAAALLALKSLRDHYPDDVTSLERELQKSHADFLGEQGIWTALEDGKAEPSR